MKTDEIISLIEDVYKKEGKLPTIAKVSELTGESVEQIKKIYHHFLLDGKMNQVKEKRVEFQKENRMELFIRLMIGLVGVSFVLCSVHFTYNFNALAMNKFWAFMLSCSMILFTSLAFTIASFIGGKTAKMIYTLWIIGVSYSIFTAVAGQYNDFRKYVANDKESSVDTQIFILSDQLKDFKKKQEELVHWRAEETMYTSNPDLKLENPSTWKRISSGVNELKSVESKIEEVQDKLMELNSSNYSENKTIYHWLSQITGINADLIQFLVIVFPSIFLDLCAGICLKFAFFYRKSIDTN